MAFGLDGAQGASALQKLLFESLQPLGAGFGWGLLLQPGVQHCQGPRELLEAAALLLELAGLNLLLLALLVLLLLLRLQSAALPLDALAQLRIQRFQCRGGIRQFFGAGLGDGPLELALPR